VNGPLVSHLLKGLKRSSLQPYVYFSHRASLERYEVSIFIYLRISGKLEQKPLWYMWGVYEMEIRGFRNLGPSI
jgi:hypothetical protein